MKPLSEATAALFKPMGILPTDRLRVYLDGSGHFEVLVSSETWHRRASSGARTWLAAVPERKMLDGDTVSPGARWQLGATDFTCELIRAHWSLEQLEFSEEAQQLYDAILFECDRHESNRELIAAFKEGGRLPDELLGLESPDPDCKLAAYQKVAATASLRVDGFGQFGEQGTGKTPITIAAISRVARECREELGRMARVVIVCPKNVRQNWLREIEKFTAVGGKVDVIRGGEVARITGIIEALVPEPGCDFSAVIMSYEVMTRSIATLQAVEWDLAILDEGHNVKTPDAKRTRASWKLRDASRRRHLLTGTPVCNTMLDLYAQLEFLGRGYSGFSTWHAFKEFYGVFDSDGESGYTKLIGVQNKPFMKERLSALSYICTKKEVMPDLPDKVYDIVEVEMGPRQLEIYQQVAAQLALEIEADLAGSANKAMTVQNVLTKLLRLTQITSGYVVWDKVVDQYTGETVRPRRVEYIGENPKLKMLIELLREKRPEEKTIVWACFIPDIETISARLTAEGVKHVTLHGSMSEQERQDAMNAFNLDPSVRVFVGNQGAGGVGINLPGSDPRLWGTPEDLGTDADHVIYYVQDWSQPKRSQSEDRNHGKNRNRRQVRVTDLCVPDSIDEEIRDRVLKKRHEASDVKDVRDILQNVLKNMGRGRDAA